MAATPGAAGMSWPQLAGAQAHVEKEEKRPKRGKKIPHVAWITPHDACVDFACRINCKCVCIPWASMSMARQRATRTADGCRSGGGRYRFLGDGRAARVALRVWSSRGPAVVVRDHAPGLERRPRPERGWTHTYYLRDSQSSVAVADARAYAM